MSAIVALADRDDANYPLSPTTRFFDFNAVDCTTDPGYFVTRLDLDSETFETESFGSFLANGDLQSGIRDGSRLISFNLHWWGKEVPDLMSDMRSLAEYLRTGNVFMFQAEDDDVLRYYDLDASSRPNVFRGQDAAFYRLSHLLLEPEGLPIRLIAHPDPRRAAVTLDTVTISQAVLDRDFLISNPGTAESDMRMTITPLDTGTVAAVRIARREQGNLTEFRTLYMHDLTTATFKLDTAGSAIGDSSGGSAPVTSFATRTDLARRLRLSITPTDRTALEGLFKLQVRLRATGGTTGTSRFKVLARYGASTDDLVESVATPVPVDFDWRDVDTPNYVEVDLGFVRGSTLGDRLIIELWASIEVGDQTLAWDLLVLEPADSYRAVGGVAGFKLGDWSREQFLAESLTGTGTLKRETYRLNAITELASARPSAGQAMPAGLHSVSVDAWLREPGDNPAAFDTARLRVRKNAANHKSLLLRSKKNQRWTRVQDKLQWTVSAAEETALDLFSFHVEFVGATLAGRTVRVASMEHGFMRPLSSDTSLVLDSYDKRSYLKGGGAGRELADFPLENTYPRVPPGDSVWVVSLLDPPTDPGYVDLDERGPTARSVLARSAEVEIILIPRDNL